MTAVDPRSILRVIIDGALKFVENAGGIEKLRKTLAAFHALDKRNAEEVRQFVLKMGESASSSRALCAAALFGCAVADTVYTAHEKVAHE